MLKALVHRDHHLFMHLQIGFEFMNIYRINQYKMCLIWPLCPRRVVEVSVFINPGIPPRGRHMVLIMRQGQPENHFVFNTLTSPPSLRRRCQLMSLKLFCFVKTAVSLDSQQYIYYFVLLIRHSNIDLWGVELVWNINVSALQAYNTPVLEILDDHYRPWT